METYEREAIKLIQRNLDEYVQQAENLLEVFRKDAKERSPSYAYQALETYIDAHNSQRDR